MNVTLSIAYFLVILHFGWFLFYILAEVIVKDLKKGPKLTGPLFLTY